MIYVTLASTAPGWSSIYRVSCPGLPCLLEEGQWRGCTSHGSHAVCFSILSLSLSEWPTSCFRLTLCTVLLHFVSLVLFCVGHWEHFLLALHPFHVFPFGLLPLVSLAWFLVCYDYLGLQHTNSSHLSCSSSRTCHFSQEACFLFLESRTKNKFEELSVLTCWSVLSCRPPRWTEKNTF